MGCSMLTDNPTFPVEATRRAFRYVSPGWHYVADDLSYIVYWFILCGILGYWWPPFELHLPTYGNNADLLQRLLGLGASAVAAWLLNTYLRRVGDGYGITPLFGGSNRLRVVSVPGRLWIDAPGEDGWLLILTVSPHKFLMREHPERVEEARREERARLAGYGQHPDHYRRAFEVIADDDQRQVRLASVASEAQARDLIRWLQSIDAEASGTDGAGVRTRTDEQPGAMPLDPQPR